MATHVVVLSGDLRRAQVKVTPATFMIDVLEAACAKLNLTSDRYLLKSVPRPLSPLSVQL